MDKKSSIIMAMSLWSFCLLANCSPAPVDYETKATGIAAEIPSPRTAGSPSPEPTPTQTIKPTSTVAPTSISTQIPPTDTPLPLPEDQIAFISTGNFGSALFLMNSDGSNKRMLANDLSIFEEERGFAWSPDGSKIAFTGKPSSDLQDSSDIYVIDANGENLRLLAKTEKADRFPSWSPDGEWVAFISGGYLSTAELYLAAVDRNWWGSILDTYLIVEDTPRPFPFEVFDLTWSPDGRWLGFAIGDGFNGFYLKAYDMKNPDKKEISSLVNQGIRNTRPAWSPNGSHFAFSSEAGYRFELFKVSIGVDSEPVMLTNHQSLGHVKPVWSPDSQKILYTVLWGKTKWDIFVIDVDGSNQIRLTGDPSRENADERGAYYKNAVWSLDGKRIVYETNQDGFPDIYVMNADGSGKTNLTNSPSTFDQAPAWQP